MTIHFQTPHFRTPHYRTPHFGGIMPPAQHTGAATGGFSGSSWPWSHLYHASYDDAPDIVDARIREILDRRAASIAILADPKTSRKDGLKLLRRRIAELEAEIARLHGLGAAGTALGLQRDLLLRELQADMMAVRSRITDLEGIVDVQEVVIYGLVSAVGFLATRYIIPDDQRVLKWAGYTASAACAAVAIWKAV